ncbi:MAG TPA: NADH-quinone oxidoreductase subunit H [Verrucomicrobiae bacterium]|nr:NADH-quinone oxidoreductase subunit H [Verrucomicrobiae bacterium]
MNVAIHLALVLLFPPLLLGIIGKTKAGFAGRTGASYLQPYHDILKLLRKDSVFSGTTTWVFRAAPVITLAALLTASLLLPLGNHASPLSFRGDMLLFAYLLGLGRFFTVSAALDTGSSFEGMGGAREVTFSCLAEGTVFFALIAFSRITGSASLTGMLTAPLAEVWVEAAAPLLLLAGGLFVVLLAENSRVPFDDPNTHLELTMIHEVMVLDHSGPLYGCILYGASVKLLLFGALFLHVVVPFHSGNTLLDWGVFVLSMALLAVGVGVVESVMARLRLTRVPQLLAGACIVSAFSLLLLAR